MFHEVSASSLVKLDLDGNIIGPSEHGINQSGYHIHSAVHMARPDVGSVIHTHTVAGTAVSAQRAGLLPITQTALGFFHNLAYHDYEGLTLDPDERKRLVVDLGDKNAMILRNHGLLTLGATVPAAFQSMFFLEKACQMQVAAMAGGAELIYPSEKVIQKFKRPPGLNKSDGQRVWTRLLRMLDAQDPSFRT
jgi:ribulose-5-phosphate 4-epimerase/fuculose-1-phosphate aldolase